MEIIILQFFFLALFVGIALVVIIISLAIAVSDFTGAPFVTTKDDRLETIIKLAKIKKGQLIADLGSGNGKIVIALAQKGAIAHGFEVNPLLVLFSRYRIKKLGIDDRAKIYFKSFWSVNYSKYDLVVIYGLPGIMKKLEKRFLKELKPGSKVISNYFTFPSWKPELKDNNIIVYQR